MLTKDFAYHLPESHIARYPTPERTASKLLALNYATGALSDYRFADIISLLKPGDLLVLNNSKVMPARLQGKKQSGGKIEILIERILNEKQAWVQIKASKSPKPNSWLILGSNILVQIQEYNPKTGMYLINVTSDTSILKILDQYGEIPLPPYMHRSAEPTDIECYQTVYAQPLGSVAAPTAGLHFTQDLLAAIQAKNIDIGYVTLHVGAGTFQPLRVQNIAEHKMHSELLQISQELCDKIQTTRNNGGRIVCVGTTSVRALEAAALSGNLTAVNGETDIFITPGYKFKIVDALITNFHLPESTLLMLVSAFAGKNNIFNAYEYAIKHNYRFYSYGDAMFITGN